MKREALQLLLRTLLGATLIFAITGCSGDSPLSTATDNGVTELNLLPPGDPVQLAARVETTDRNRLMLTFYGHPDTVVAAHNCEIVRFNGNGEAPVPFSGIQPGDSCEVTGIRQQNQYVLAHRLRICHSNDPGASDVAFRDAITAIDYAAGTFTVASRTETILVDANTVIWTHFVNSCFAALGDGGNGGNPDKGKIGRDTTLAFTDLQVGFIVEVKADIIDDSNLLARKIKVATESYRTCITFTANLTSIDLTTRVVTFDGQSWNGWVCPKAKLSAVDGTVLNLEDFIVGDLVWVKGLPLEGDSLKICEMVRQ